MRTGLFENGRRVTSPARHPASFCRVNPVHSQVRRAARLECELLQMNESGFMLELPIG
jgi:hypothetical protein